MKNYEVTSDKGIEVTISDEMTKISVRKGQHVMLDEAQAKKHQKNIEPVPENKPAWATKSEQTGKKAASKK